METERKIRKIEEEVEELRRQVEGLKELGERWLVEKEKTVRYLEIADGIFIGTITLLIILIMFKVWVRA